MPRAGALCQTHGPQNPDPQHLFTPLVTAPLSVITAPQSHTLAITWEGLCSPSWPCAPFCATSPALQPCPGPLLPALQWPTSCQTPQDSCVP